jgi:N-glycosylase/DNA lyase
MNIFEHENKIVVEGLTNFNLADIFECGQCFRFNKSGEAYEGVAHAKYLRVYQQKNKIYFEASPEDFNNTWRGFFDLDRDYQKISETLRKDEILRKASDFASGIRILKQEPFECLISFIISQNNNIPRIKKIIGRLCENFGERLPDNNFAFPSPAKLASLSLPDLNIIKSGFRAKYIHEAAKRINSGEINLDLIYNLNLESGAQYLKKLNGVGDKISACVLLF